MTYHIKQLAELAGVSVRTLHHYDAIGLLKPMRDLKNSYRKYGERELLRLQQILFLRELEFPLPEIKKIMDSPGFDPAKALADQKALIQLKRKRLDKLIRTIDETIKKLNNEKNMDDKELYSAFSKEEGEKYAAEAKERWGHTEAYRQSMERVKKMTKEDWARISKESDDLMRELVESMPDGIGSDKVQSLIGRHYASLRNFYEPNLEMYRGLGEMYVADQRFAAYYEKYAPGLAIFMREAIARYCDGLERSGKK